jgi:hypothetical protein
VPAATSPGSPSSASPASGASSRGSPPSASPASGASSPAPTGRRPKRPRQPRRSPGNPAGTDSALNPDARLGALLISAQALNFLLGARNQCILDRVVELNPWSMESTGYRVFHN